MTYVLCSAKECINHDGDDCTLEEVSLVRYCTVDGKLGDLRYTYNVNCWDFRLGDEEEEA